MYLATPSTPGVRAAMDAGTIGCMAGPRQGNKLRPEWTWAADCDGFGDAWSPGRYVTHLEKSAPFLPTCLFAVVPDAVADATETARRWAIWAPVVAELGYPRAFVLQDGCRSVPWDDIACLFIGGSTDYKLSEDAYRWALEAKERGKWVHWGRVNSRRRFGALSLVGDSCDGTYLAFGPDTNLPKLTSWLNHLPWAVSA